MYTESQIAEKVGNLKVGQTLLMSVRKIGGGKVSLQFAEKILNPTNANSGVSAALSLLNADDPRFQNSGARRAWLSATPTKAAEIFPEIADVIDAVNNGTEKETEVFVGILNPSVNGIRFRVQVTETTKPTDYQAANVKTAAKRAGKDGNIIKHNGLPVFSNTAVTVGQVNHTWLESDPAPSADDSTMAASSVGEAVVAEDQIEG